MRDENCIFCKILNGDIPSRTIFEDEDFQVIMDVEPATKGHCLILPIAKKVAAHLKETLQCDGINLVQNNGEAAGQTVHHFHMHVIPRYEGGNAKDVTWSHSAFRAEELDAIRDQIQM